MKVILNVKLIYTHCSGVTMVTLEELQRRDYEVEYEGQRFKLKPSKVWKVQPKGRKGFVMALFRLPNGKVVRKVVAKVDEQGNIMA